MSPVRFAGGGSLRPSSGKIGHVAGGVFTQAWPPLTASSVFTGTDGAAPDASLFTVFAASGSTATILSNALRMQTGTTGNPHDRVKVTNATALGDDQVVTADVTFASTSVETYLHLVVRDTTKGLAMGDNTGYRVEVNLGNGTATLANRVTAATIGTGTVSGLTANTLLHFELSAVGTAIQFRAWAGSTRPSTATIAVTDSGITTGGQAGVSLQSGATGSPARVMTLSTLSLAAASAGTGGGTGTGTTQTDTFTGTDGAAPTAATWTLRASSGSSAKLSSNALRMVTGSTGGYNDHIDVIDSAAGQVADARVLIDVIPRSSSEAYWALMMRSPVDTALTSDGYRIEIGSAGYVGLQAVTGYNGADLITNATIAGYGVGATVHLDVQLAGTAITIYAWTGSTKPSTPTISVTNGTYTAAGFIGFTLGDGSAAGAPATWDVDNWSLTTATAASTGGGGTTTGGGGTTASTMPTSNVTNSNGTWNYLYGTDFTTDVALGSFPGSAYSSRFDAYDGFGDTSKRGTYSTAKTIDVTGGAMRVDMHNEGSTYYVGAPIVRTVAGSAYSGQVYGRYSTRMRSVTLAGNPTGYKVAFMLWPTDDQWPAHGEYDFPETDVGTGSYAQANAHYANANGGQDQFVVPSSKVIADWHIYTIEWGPGRIEHFIDGTSIGASTTQVSTFPMRWTLQCETDLGTAPTSSMRARIEIDWVAMWSRS